MSRVNVEIEFALVPSAIIAVYSTTPQRVLPAVDVYVNAAKEP